MTSRALSQPTTLTLICFLRFGRIRGIAKVIKTKQILVRNYNNFRLISMIFNKVLSLGMNVSWFTGVVVSMFSGQAAMVSKNAGKYYGH